ncbi:MAG: homoserine kinase [Geminicoccaceae bacterium]
MAVYTEVPDDELTRFVADYDIGTVTSFKGIAEGVENSNFLMYTDRGSFILTLYEKRVAPEDLPFFLGLMEHLAVKGFTCPTPVKDRVGRSLKILAGRPAAVITFLKGIWIRRPQTRHCQKVGRALVRMHLASSDFDMTRPNALSCDAWRPLLGQCGRQADTVQAGLYEELQTELDRLEEIWPQALPDGVIHADLFPDNVFFLGDELSGIIDFYFACTDALAYDIAVCLNAWCFETDGSFNISKARAMLLAYGAERKLDAAEYDALPVLARGAAMRFLLTRLYDWLNTPDGALVKPKDPLEYVRKLRFHRTVESAREYGIDP